MTKKTPTVKFDKAIKNLKRVDNFLIMEFEDAVLGLMSVTQRLNTFIFFEDDLSVREEHVFEEIKETADELSSYIQMGKQLTSRLKKLNRNCESIIKKQREKNK